MQGAPIFDGILIVVVGAVFFALVEIETQMRPALRSADVTD